MYVTRITNRLSSDAVQRARRQGIITFGETLISSLGTSLRNIKDNEQIYYVTSPPIRRDPETGTHLMKCLAL